MTTRYYSNNTEFGHELEHFTKEFRMALSAADAMKMTAGQKAVFEQLKTLRQQGVIDYYACLNVESDAWYVQFGEARIDFNTSREVLTFCYGVTAGVRRMKRARRVILRARLKSQV